MRIVCISDTHSQHAKIPGGLPEGELLIHAGDFCGANNKVSVGTFLEWFGAQAHPHKILVAGNHDGPFEREPDWCRAAIAEICPEVHYLQDEGCTIEGLQVWGSPWQPEFGDWHFNLPRGDALAEKWAAIPASTDLLVTHGPPMGILDACPPFDRRFEAPPEDWIHVGCEALRSALARVRPRVHVFGHIHESHGRHEEGGTIYVNASIMDGLFSPENAAQVVELE